MSQALGDKWTARFKNAEGLPLDLIASRLPEEEAFYKRLQELVWALTQEMFSSRVVTPGKTRTSDLVWWWRQRVNDLGLGTWFHPSVDVQRRGATSTELGDDPVIERGDVLHCDVGITVARLNTDTQHMAYVLQSGETDAPEGLRRALQSSNALQDIVMDELRPGRTGNQILAAARARMKEKGIDGTIYSHPIGLHGHGAGPLIGLWDYQDGVAGRGDATGDSEHVVVDRAAGDDAGRGVGRPAGPDGAGRGRDHRRRGARALGAPPAGQAVPGPLTPTRRRAGATVLSARAPRSRPGSRPGR